MHRRLGDARRAADHRHRARRPDRGGPRRRRRRRLLDWGVHPARDAVTPYAYRRAMAEPIAERPHMPDYGVDTDAVGAAAVVVGGRPAGRGPATSGSSRRRPAGRPHALPVWGVWDDDEPRVRLVVRAAAPARPPTSRRTRRSCVMPSTTPSSACRSRAGRRAVEDRRRQIDAWIERYLDEVPPARASPPTSCAQNLLFELVPERALRRSSSGRRSSPPGRRAGASSDALIRSTSCGQPAPRSRSVQNTRMGRGRLGSRAHGRTTTSTGRSGSCRRGCASSSTWRTPGWCRSASGRS